MHQRIWAHVLEVDKIYDNILFDLDFSFDALAVLELTQEY